MNAQAVIRSTSHRTAVPRRGRERDDARSATGPSRAGQRGTDQGPWLRGTCIRSRSRPTYRGRLMSTGGRASRPRSSENPGEHYLVCVLQPVGHAVPKGGRPSALFRCLLRCPATILPHWRALSIRPLGPSGTAVARSATNNILHPNSRVVHLLHLGHWTARNSGETATGD
jgi:hypothetical protein